jgi:hypothetical protein
MSEIIVEVPEEGIKVRIGYNNNMSLIKDREEVGFKIENLDAVINAMKEAKAKDLAMVA